MSEQHSSQHAAVVVAQRDWHTRARVRILEDTVSQSIDPAGVRYFHAGEECELIQWGHKGRFVLRDTWWDSLDIDGAHIVDASKVEVVAILDEVTPLYGENEPDGWVGLPEWMIGEME